MTPLRITTWFKRRMLPLVVAASAVVAAAAPLAFWLQKRIELMAAARAEAARAAEVVRATIIERPRLWRYDSIKLGERLAAAGLDRYPIRIVGGAVEVRVDFGKVPPMPRAALWGRCDLRLDEQVAFAAVEGRAVLPQAAPDGTLASVWVALDGAPLVTGTALLAVAFALLAAVLGTVLYLLPVRALGGAERRADQLYSQLALTLREEDRRRIARDLHDGAGQAITAARLELLALAAAAPAQSEAVRRIASHLDEALAEVRRSTAALGPPALAELGFSRAVARHCDAFADAAGLAVRCEIAPDLPPLSGELELHVYRIVQEALTNVARHAGATAATISISMAGGGAVGARRRLRVTVEDDGAGRSDDVEEGRGLAGMRERARLLGGELHLGPGAGGGGLRIEANFPIRPDSSQDSVEA